MNFLTGLDLGSNLRCCSSPNFLKDFLPIALWSMAVDASFSLVEKKCIQIQIKERAIICAACGNYISVPHQDRIQLLELAAGHTARTRAVMDIHGPLAHTLQSLSLYIAPGPVSADTEMLSQKQCSKAPHCLMGRRDRSALLPARSCASLCAEL